MPNYVYHDIKKWLMDKKITQRKVAVVLKKNTNYVNKKINGTGPDFSLEEARKMHEKLGVPMTYFFTPQSRTKVQEKP